MFARLSTPDRRALLVDALYLPRLDRRRRPLVVSGVDLVQACVSHLRAGLPPPSIAARFHNGVAVAISEVCQTLAERTGVRTVALSGGVFQNLLLLHGTVDALTTAGGISLGQAVVAATLDPEP